MSDPLIELRRSAGEVSLLEVLTLLARHKRFIAVVMIVVGVLTAVYSLISPHSFQSGISILPPEKQDHSGLSALLSQTSGLDLQMLGDNRSSDFYSSVLHSRTIIDSLLANYPDVHDYFSRGSKSESDMAGAFASVVQIEFTHEGLTNITTKLSTGYLPAPDEEKHIAQLTAEIAAGMAMELDKLNRIKIVSRAHNARVYIEEQLHRVKAQLDSMYTAYSTFQHENKVLALDKQVENEVRSAAELQSQIMELEYELRYMTRTQTPNNMEFEQKQAKLSALKESYNKMQAGGDTSEFFLAFPQIPSLQKTYANMSRDLKAMEQVYAYLQTQFFQERVQEERDTPTVQVLDAPVVPERRSGPHRVSMVMLGLLIGLILGCAIVFIRQYVLTMAQRPDERARMDRLMASIAPQSKRKRNAVLARGNGEPPDTGTKNGHPPTNGGRE